MILLLTHLSEPTQTANPYIFHFLFNQPISPAITLGRARGFLRTFEYYRSRMFYRAAALHVAQPTVIKALNTKNKPV